MKTTVLYWLITLTTDLKSKTLTTPWHYHHYPVSVSPFPHSTDTQPPVASSPFFIHHTMYIACPVTNLWWRQCQIVKTLLFYQRHLRLIKDLQLELSLPSVASDCQLFFKLNWFPNIRAFITQLQLLTPMYLENDCVKTSSAARVPLTCEDNIVTPLVTLPLPSTSRTSSMYL